MKIEEDLWLVFGKSWKSLGKAENDGFIIGKNVYTGVGFEHPGEYTGRVYPYS